MRESTHLAPNAFPSAHRAISFLLAELGPPEAAFEYTAADGRLAGVVLDWSAGEGGAQPLRQMVARRDADWVIGPLPAPRPLYRWGQLEGHQRVYLVANERQVHALAARNLAATCIPPGEEGADGVDWQPLAGKEVAISLGATITAATAAKRISCELRNHARQLKCSVRHQRLPAEWLQVDPQELPGAPNSAPVEHNEGPKPHEEPRAKSEKRGGRSEEEGERRDESDPADAPTECLQGSGAESPPAFENDDEWGEYEYEDEWDYEWEDDDPPPAEHPASISDEAQIRPAAAFAPAEIAWLWHERIALGKLTLLAGDPGLGKSLITLDIAARLSSGRGWPGVDQERGTRGEGREETREESEGDGESRRPSPLAPRPSLAVGDVLLLSAEDDPADTISPRLRAAGADLSRVHILEHLWTRPAADGSRKAKLFRVENDIVDLFRIVLAMRCKLVIIDPVTAFLGKSDLHHHGPMQRLLGELAELAQHSGAAVLAVTHLNKRTSGPALYRTMGSLAFTATARSVHLVSKDTSDPTGRRRLLLPAKQNLSAAQHGLAFHIKQTPSGQAVVEWEGVAVQSDAEAALSSREKMIESPAMDEARQWLADTLSDGEVPVVEIREKSRLEGTAWRTLRRAKDEMGVQSYRSRRDGERDSPWVWKLSRENRQPGANG